MVKLQWKPPVSDGGTAITEYIIEMKGAAESLYVNVGTVGPILTGEVYGLKETHKYQFRVIAVNRVGPGAPSDCTPVHIARDRFRKFHHVDYYFSCHVLILYLI